MEKKKSEKLARLLYNYLDSLDIDRIEVDISEGSNSFYATIVVPDKRKDDVDEGEFARIIEKEPSLVDIDVNLTCYEESEVEGDDEVEDPDAGAGDADPDEEDEVEADRLTVRSNPDEDDDDYLEEDNEEEEEEDDDDAVEYDDEEEEEYEPTQYDWEDIIGFYGDDDDCN